MLEEWGNFQPNITKLLCLLSSFWPVGPGHNIHCFFLAARLNLFQYSIKMSASLLEILKEASYPFGSLLASSTLMDILSAFFWMLAILMLTTSDTLIKAKKATAHAAVVWISLKYWDSSEIFLKFKIFSIVKGDRVQVFLGLIFPAPFRIFLNFGIEHGSVLAFFYRIMVACWSA